MTGQPHIIDIRVWNFGFGHNYRIFPEFKMINAVRTFGDCEKRLAVESLHPRYQTIFIVELDCTTIKNGIDS